MSYSTLSKVSRSVIEIGKVVMVFLPITWFIRIVYKTNL